MNRVSLVTRDGAHTREKRARGSAGFSLIELMVVIAIIAGLATIVAVNVLGALDDADITQAKAEITNFKSALTAYRIHYKRFPTEEEGLRALVQNADGEKFLDVKQIPPDPWGNDYVYKIEGSRDFVIISYGADGVPGGTGIDADISSDDLEGTE